jgi:branched-subunit amino acid permease
VIAAYVTLAVLGAWLFCAAYHALLCPPRLGRLSESHVLAVLLGCMVGGVLLVVVAGIRAVQS